MPNDPRWSSQWGPKTVKLPEAWEWLQDQGLPTFGTHDVRVAVFDTGADLDHPDLVANICDGRSFISGAPTPQDDNDHGSHTAGIIAAGAQAKMRVVEDREGEEAPTKTRGGKGMDVNR